MTPSLTELDLIIDRLCYHVYMLGNSGIFEMSCKANILVGNLSDDYG